MLRRTSQLLLCVCLLGSCTRESGERHAKTTIEYHSGVLTIDDVQVGAPPLRSEVLRLLGPPSRSPATAPDRYTDTWDDRGIYAVPNRSGTVYIAISCCFQSEGQIYSPASAFDGVLMVLGERLTPQSSADDLRRSGFATPDGWPPYILTREDGSTSLSGWTNKETGDLATLGIIWPAARDKAQ